MKTKYKTIFGPVPSRRFGLSLGVDLVPFKTCSLNCVFCHLGQTTHKTITRKEYVPLKMVLSELEAWLKTDGRADYITLSGSGEPTLHSRFGEVLSFIKIKGDIPTVLLTNGTLLTLPEVREAASHADVVKVSLSVWNQDYFKWINRPHPELHFKQVVEGQKTFRTQYKGQLWMEVFLVDGMNSIQVDVQKIATLAKEIAPDRIQLNTAVRPPAEEFVTALSKDEMEELASLFNPKAEVISEFDGIQDNSMKINENVIFSILKRRPCTAEQIADTFGMHLNEVSKYLGKLIRKGKIQITRSKDVEYYR